MFHNSSDQAIQAQWKTRLSDVLSPAAREKRKLFLIASTVTLVFVVLGLFPTKIEALGITFQSHDRLQMILLLGAITLYAAAGFILYAWSDWHVLLRGAEAASTGYIDEFTKGRASKAESLNFLLRVIFDFILPTIYGGYALWRLYRVLIVQTAT